MKGRLNIDYGCGIGPKIVLSGDEMMMGIVSQSSTDREVGFYKININWFFIFWSYVLSDEIK